ncbi:uncharacterized protein LOC128951184 [Oppia nitens]|uniref:uncharacterized protein LOC128951184 n=1 Tax=Oppia nitens TaxID=1686743 RepID=UPI0023DCEA0F|nr:uncharacterized protein LOC128951184 [Oppia nitens]
MNEMTNKSIHSVIRLDINLSEDIQLGDTDDYQLITRIGCGKYGVVFEAIDVRKNKRCAIKVLKPVIMDKVSREVTILRHLCGGPNIISLKDVIMNCKIPSLVFPFVAKETLRDILTTLDDTESRLYLFKIIKAIDYCHQQGVMHRDIKPSNVVIDRQRQLLRLIDFGLADFYTTDKSYSVAVASRYYKPPELLLNYPKYDYSMDMWSFGCVMAAVIFKKDPFLAGLDNLDQLMRIVSVLGNQCLKNYIRKYKLNPLPQLIQILESNIKCRQWFEFVNEGNNQLATDLAIDLVDKLMIFDHKHRLTANECKQHPYFGPYLGK